MQGFIHSIETFGTVDGPGVRLVVFFSGCPLRCLYCHNPDTWTQKGATKMDAQEILEIYERNKGFYSSVVFPEPVPPTTATSEPRGITKLASLTVNSWEVR